MADLTSHILKAASTKAKQLSLDNRKLVEVPTVIDRLEHLESLSLKNNDISELPSQIGLLRNVRTCVLYNVMYRINYSMCIFS